MKHFRMELHCPNGSLTPTLSKGRGRPESSIGDILSRTDHLEIVGDGGDGIAMRHPHLRVLFEALEERIRSVDGLKVGTAILTRVGFLDLTAEGVRNELRKCRLYLRR